MAKGAGEWQENEPLSASKLNANDQLNVRDVRVGPGLGIQRNAGPGGKLSITLDERNNLWEIVRAEVTEMPGMATPLVAGVKIWDGNTEVTTQFYAKVTQFPSYVYEDETYIDILICRPFGGVTIDGGTSPLLDPNGVPVVWQQLAVGDSVIVQIIAAAADGDLPGEYLSGAIGTGNPTGMPPQGLTFSDTPNCVVENTSEAGLANAAGATMLYSHWLYNGLQSNSFPGIVRGFKVGGDAAGLPIVTICAPNPFTLFEVELSNPYAEYTVFYGYTVKDRLGYTIGTNMFPLWNYELSFEGATHGMAFYDETGTLRLAYIDSQQYDEVFAVGVTMSTGINGTGSPVTNATYTYNVTDALGNVIGTAMSPAYGRPQGLLTGPATAGFAYWDINSGGLVLAWVNEIQQLFGCSDDDEE